MYSKTRSIAWVMGISSAQAILRSVQDDCKLSSGVYAIGVTSFGEIKTFAGGKNWLIGLIERSNGAVDGIFYWKWGL